MAETIYKARKMDAEIQKREQELRKEFAEKAKIKGENLLKKPRMKLIAVISW